MILVFGSINLDIAMASERPPAAGETVIGATSTLSAGGKGANQAAAAARAGAPARLIGRVGTDALAALALAGPEAAGVDTSGVGRADQPTGLATIWVTGDGENRIVVASGANGEARADDVGDTLLGPETILLLQMEVPAAENWRLAGRAKAAGTRVLLNLAPAAPLPASALAHIDILVVNEGEAAVATGLDTASEAALLAALGHLARSRGLDVVLTLGERGARHLSQAGQTVVPAVPASVVDTTAAGDTFVGVLAAGLDAGEAMAAALRRASAAAALCCERAGAQTAQPSAADIARRLDEVAASRY